MNKIDTKVIDLILEAAKLARANGIDNILQPGLVKEIIMADLLGHDLIPTKRGADACSKTNSSELFEYLSCKEGGAGQFDRMFRDPIDNEMLP